MDSTGAISNVIMFLYDQSGEMIGMYENGLYYYYAKNPLGDVVRCISIAGTSENQYQYDAWGHNYYDSTGTNPIRYRGYYYDKGIGMYYLQSRYYEPGQGRFINADDPTMLKQTRNSTDGLNLFAYCNNDPINNTDPTGRFSGTQFVKALLGGIFGLLMQFISDLICIATRIAKTLSTIGTYLSSFFKGVVEALFSKRFYKAVIFAAVGNGIKQITDRIIYGTKIDMRKYAYSILSTIIKYGIKHYFKVKISEKLERKLYSKLPVVLQFIFSYTLGKLQNLKYYNITVKTFKGIVSKYFSSIFTYVRKNYFGLEW